MDLLDLIVTAVALSMDAFAVSVSKGLTTPNARWKHGLICGVWFGGFQALMPLIGFLLASSFANAIRGYDHWIAFGLMAFIGANMIREAFGGAEELDASFAPRTMLVLAVATSIDALATGVSFAMTDSNIWIAISFIGATTFLFSLGGIKVGSVFGNRYQKKAEIIGGVILILMGTKILLEHLLGAA